MCELEHLMLQAWFKAMEKLKNSLLNITPTNKPNIKPNPSLIEALTNSLTKEIFDNSIQREKFALGIIREDLSFKLRSSLEKEQISLSKIHSLLYKANLTFKKYFHKLLWNHRCSITVKIDQ